MKWIGNQSILFGDFWAVGNLFKKELEHKPVLLKEAVDWLDLKQGQSIVDCTGGGGGHARAILERISPGGRLLVIDRDPDAIEKCKTTLNDFQGETTFVNEDFRFISDLCERSGFNQVHGILMDLGISSMQLEDTRRGFAFKSPGPLDMRMDSRSEETLHDFLKDTREETLADTLFQYGQERYSRRIAKGIKDYIRKTNQPDTAGLAEVIRRSVPAGYRYGRIHPATRSFQALRIQVNHELDSLHRALPEGIERLSPKGRMAVISFHSLEDRMVKIAFREAQKNGAGQILVKKPLKPSRHEIKDNPRSRSACLRVFRKADLS